MKDVSSAKKANKRIKWPKIGAIVKVVFNDHGIEDEPNGVFACVVIGEVFKSDKTSLVLRYWHCLGVDKNDEFVSLVKKAVTGITELEEKKEE